MKLSVITPSDKLLEQRDYRSFLKIKVNDVTKFHVYDGEPEDANLNRDFNSCYNIPDLMKLAYEAGKNGEPLVIQNVILDE